MHYELADLAVTLRKRGTRRVCGVDSRVAVGAWAKGRSSSRQINRVFRSSLGWSVLGRIRLCPIWIGTESNPSDDPSRDVRLPKPAPAWFSSDSNVFAPPSKIPRQGGVAKIFSFSPDTCSTADITESHISKISCATADTHNSLLVEKASQSRKVPLQNSLPSKFLLLQVLIWTDSADL